MARIDANIVLRYLTDEPPDQAERVARLFQRVAAGQESVAVDEIVVAEVVWTLSSYYRMPKRRIADLLLRFLAADGIGCRDGNAVQRALVLFEDRNVDFADALLAARVLDEGQPEIYSFDRDFDRIVGLRRIEPT